MTEQLEGIEAGGKLDRAVTALAKFVVAKRLFILAVLVLTTLFWGYQLLSINVQTFFPDLLPKHAYVDLVKEYPDFGGANIVSLYGGYSLNPHVSVELWGSQILGNFSNGWMASVNVVHEAFPEWRVSPFFTLGAGAIHTKPKSTIIQGEDRTDQIGHVGAGFRVYATRRFLLRAEYKSYVVFTSRDENEEVEEWKVGFAFFF